MEPEVRATRSFDPARLRRICARLAGLSAIALLAACSSHQASLNPGAQAAEYAARAHGNYKPPGPPGDPWGPYIAQASVRFDVPAKWIRQVMKVESGGHEYINGRLTVSPTGAMGLMQLEPMTYREMAARYGLGPDPFNPRDNIMAGTAYIHEMYEIYGSPGFLAAYNAGPGRLDDYLDYRKPLPAQTRRYVAMIAPNIAGVYPAGRAQAAQVAMNRLPAKIPAGIRPGAGGSATARLNRAQLTLNRPAVPPPPRPAPQAPARMAALAPPPAAETPRAVTPAVSRTVPPPLRQPHHFGGFSLIPSADAATPVLDGPDPIPPPARAPTRQAIHTAGAVTHQSRPLATGHWAVQVGAYNTPAHAKAALGIAELAAVAVLMKGHPVIEPVTTSNGRFFRARFVGLGHQDAVDACRRLSHAPTGCAVVSPDAG